MQVLMRSSRLGCAIACVMRMEVVMVMTVDNQPTRPTQRPQAHTNKYKPHEDLGPPREPRDIEQTPGQDAQDPEQSNADAMPQAPSKPEPSRPLRVISGDRREGR